MDYWARVRMAVLRGIGGSILGGFVAAGAHATLPPLLPEPWATLAFLVLLALPVRLWPLVPNGQWWEDAWAYGVLLVALVVAGMVLGHVLLASMAAVGFALFLATRFYNQRRNILLQAPSR
ncbi:MAG: hypothetical protein M0Z54_09650 [Thermaerobacter sp.]|nr:hypothetical protein [Thermaerobacter sp.]